VTAPPLLSAHGLTVVHEGRKILDAVDLDIGPGEILTIIGPNGCGKTTLVRALMGLERLQAGHITRRPGLRIGYLPQRVHVDPVLPLTVRRLLTLTRRAPAEAVAAALGEVGAGALIDAQVSTLSGGELQRALLARTLLGRPDLLVLDEPTQGVDYAGEIALYHLIADLRQRLGCAVLMISHDLHVVMAATDRVLCLHHHVCCQGQPQAVARHPAYRALFGQGAADLAVYSHDHDHDHNHDHDHDPRPNPGPAAGEAAP
jgi:zinc transport system ATP-binding protein